MLILKQCHPRTSLLNRGNHLAFSCEHGRFVATAAYIWYLSSVAANCMMIRFRYIAQPRGVRKTYCARSRNDVRRFTSRSNGRPSKKIMESLRMFVVVETVLRRG